MLFTGHPPELTPTDITFVNNIEVILDQQAPALGRNAQKALEVSPRSIWRGYGTIILPATVEPEFRQYAADLGHTPEIIVPTGVNPEALTIMDGQDDPAFRRALGPGRIVTSYVLTPELRQLTEICGGQYIVNQPDEATAEANNKGRYASLMEGVVSVPDGELVKGLDAIVDAVHMRLKHPASNGRAFVRHVQSGAGYGNRSFDLGRASGLSRQQIEDVILADNPDIWQEGEALVEEYLDLIWSPAVSFSREGFSYDNLQISHNSQFWGAWSPCPPDVLLAQPRLGHSGLQQLQHIGDRAAAILQQVIGYQGWGNSDLGITRDGRLVGLEFNARDTALCHAISVATSLLKTPWPAWRQAGHTIKSLDHFVLKDKMSFSDLHATLEKAGLLATTEVPYGIVITIPPQGNNIAGILAQENGYRRTEGLYQEALKLVGDPKANQHDHPYQP